MNRFFRSALFPLFVIVLLVYLASQMIPHGKSSEKLTTSQFVSKVENDEVATATFSSSRTSSTPA
ncbi:MAG TPA: ATP-dependent metallopeptidase FtsH/Yme1/Tma family protein [Gaiellaceae bacterium]